MNIEEQMKSQQALIILWSVTFTSTTVIYLIFYVIVVYFN